MNYRHIFAVALLAALFTVTLSKVVDAGPQLLAAHAGAIAAKSKTIILNHRTKE
jgi:hypothetical protein